MAHPTDERLYKIGKALKIGIPVMEIYRISGVDPFFLYKIQNILNMEAQLRTLNLAEANATEVIREAKRPPKTPSAATAKKQASSPR